MATEVNARLNKQPTIAFTLPIACQICLGKVKNPVLCPNQHVFCGPCMEVWLQKNQQCPACRTSMTSSRKIIGGLSHEEEDTKKLTNPDLRKARFDILYKEYENEFERMQSEIQLLKTENQILRQQTKKEGLTPSRSGDAESNKSKDTTHLLALTKKLQDATKVYEKVKGDLTRLKQENTNLKDENLSLNRETQHLRQELAGRSPQRFGRITVSTLETKLASAEKDVTRLTKALERSDKYIEELESELDGYRGGKPGATKRPSPASEREDIDKYMTNGDLDRKYYSDSKVPSTKDYGIGAENPSRRQLFSEDKGSKPSTGEKSKYSYERNGEYSYDMHATKSHISKSNGSNGGKKKVTFDLEKNTNSATSFDLELPSPLKMSANASGLAASGRVSPVKGVLKKSNEATKTSSGDKSTDYSTDLSKTLEDSLSDSYNSKYKPLSSKDDDLLYMKGREKSKEFEGDLNNNPRSRKYSADDSFLSEPSDIELKRAREKDYSLKPSSGEQKTSIRERDYQSKGSKGLYDELDRHDLDDTQYIESELDELNISLTPEFTDCMKILNRAEKNVHTRAYSPDDLTRPRSTDPDMDTAFRASTGSIGFKSSSSGTTSGNFMSSDYKTDANTNKFASSLDSYSRGRHVRSGSLDNLLIDHTSEKEPYRPSSAMSATSIMYPPTSTSKYSSGLTTGRTTLTRTPSLDNLLLARQSSGHFNKYTSVDGPAATSGFLGQRIYRGETDSLDVKSSSTGAGSSTALQPMSAKHELLSMHETNMDKFSGTTMGDGQARYSSGDAGSGVGARSLPVSDVNRRLPPSGRQTPTLSSTGTDYDRLSTGSGRITPSIPTHSEYMSLSRHNPETYTSSGRSTTLLSSLTDFSSTKPSTQMSEFRPSGYSSLPSSSSLKQPIGGRSDAYSSSASYSGLTNLSTNAYTGGSYHSLPTYTSALSTGSVVSTTMSSSYNANLDTKYASVGSRASDFTSDKTDSYTNFRSKPPYTENNYKDGSDLSNFSSKALASTFAPSVSSISANAFSTAGMSSFAGASSYLPSSSSSSSSYVPGSSYASTHGMAPSLSTSSYSASLPTSTYPSKPLDPIAESGHYSYVSNISGEFSSKNDTLGLPEPKKRLFDNSDDLEKSMSPIKANRRY